MRNRNRFRILLRWLVALGIAACFVLPSAADAQRRKKKRNKGKQEVTAKKEDITATVKTRRKGKTVEKQFDFTGLDLTGSMRMPQLLYYLDRANEELERASLERRSFIPEMVRSLDEGSL